MNVSTRHHLVIPFVACALLVIATVAFPAGSASASRQLNGKTLRNHSVVGSKLSNRSVTQRALANGAVTSAKIAPGAVTSSKLAPGVVTAAKLAPGAITAGSIARGAVTADKIATGTLTGAALTVRVVTADEAAAPLSVATATAACDAGEVALGGGGVIDDPSPIGTTALRASAASIDPAGRPTGWTVTVVNTAPLGGDVSFHAQAICA